MTRFVLRSLLALTALVSLIVPASSRADFSLGQAGNYGVIAGPNTTSIQFSNETLNSNVGAAASPTPGGNYVQFSSGTITGNFDFAGTAPSSLGSGAVDGNINSNVAAVTSAYSTLTQLSNTFAAETGTALAGSGSVDATTGKLDITGNFVFTGTTSTFLQSGALTINGTANQYVVINITDNANQVQLKNLLNLTGGITSDHVFINITGNESIGGNTNGGIINGTFFAPNATVNIDNSTLDGRIFGGVGSFQLVSGFDMNTPATVPEPASLAMILLGGGIAAGYATYRSRRALGPVTIA
jgi:choice-of-anchor A domain-containing protein